MFMYSNDIYFTFYKKNTFSKKKINASFKIKAAYVISNNSQYSFTVRLRLL